MRTIEDDILVVQNHSMWPLYWKGDEVRLLRDAYYDTIPRRGDVVVVDAPESWLFRFVQGLPHDIVDFDDRFNPAVLKVNGLVIYNYSQKTYDIGKELFYRLFGKLSFRIPDAHCLILPNDASLHLQRHPFGMAPFDSIIGRVYSDPMECPPGLQDAPFSYFDASGKKGIQLND